MKSGENWASLTCTSQPDAGRSQTEPAALAHIGEAALLAGAADPERAYIERTLPHKLALQADCAARATLSSDLVVLARTLPVLVSR